jgi:hypothetical protein
MFIEEKAKYVGIDGVNGIVDGKLITIKTHNKEAVGTVSTVKKLILEFNLTTGDIRCLNRFGFALKSRFKVGIDFLRYD